MKFKYEAFCFDDMRGKLCVLIILFLVSSCTIDRMYQKKSSKSSYAFEQVDFNDLAKLYMGKNQSPDVENIEGIYSVSSVIIKKGKGLFSVSEKEKVMDRKENYSKVVIFKDRDNSNRDYFEVPIDKAKLPSYSIRGEFSRISEGNILVYKHFEPRGKVLNYTFTYDSQKDMLEGIRTEAKGSQTIIYQLSYLKLLPKSNPNLISN